MAKCETIEKGDVQIEGVDGEVFRRVYVPHDTEKRGAVAHFYNNRKGGKATVYPETRKMFVGGTERRFNKDQTMWNALRDVMRIDTTDEQE